MNVDEHLGEALAIAGDLVDSIQGIREGNPIVDEGTRQVIANAHLTEHPIRFNLNLPRPPFLAPQVFDRPIHLPEVESGNVRPTRCQEVNE